MNLRHISIVALLAATFLTNAFSQRLLKPEDTLRNDPAITEGKLANGLTYYIRANKKPEKRAELRLVVRAGSVLEDADQQGLAHFVEHMAFDGTKSFPKNELVSFLEKVGVKLGPDVNAYTSFDETVYRLQIPTDSTGLVRTAFQILKEWASDVTFDDAEIDKERGVVVEEWRLGRGANERISNKHNPIIFYHSRYADRLPIGKKEVLDTCSHDAIRRFYRDWYRPNLMAVVAVGDFDPDMIKSLIEKDFSGLKNTASQRARTEYALPDHKETLVSVATDPELTYTNVSVFFKRAEEEERVAADYRRSIIGQLYDGMLNERISERLQQPNPPFIYGATGDSRFVGKKEAYYIYAGVKENSILGGLEAMLSEVFQAKDHGFTATEVDRAKKDMMRGMEQAYLERTKTESDNYAGEFIRNFLQEEPMPGIESEYSMYRQFLPTITLDEVDRLSGVRITPNNCVVTLSAPKKEGVMIPTEAELLATLKKAESEETTAYVDKVVSEKLVPKMPKAGSILSERILDSIGVTEWKLSNGSLVVLKPTDFKNDEILFSAFSNGGLSLSSDQDYLSNRWAATAAGLGGVGDFDAVALGKALAGKIVGVSPNLSELAEGFGGSSSPRDLESLFQLTYLYFTSPREDTAAFNAFLSRQRAALQNRSVSPEGAFFDTVQVTMAQYHYRARPFTVQLVDSIKLDKAMNFYRDRFADANGFVFFFVGNFVPDSIKTFVEQYLASLPALNRGETWKDSGIRPPRGVISKEVRRGIEPKSLVRITFTGPFEWSRQNRYDFQSMLEYLNIKLREVMREDKSGVYNVNASGSPSLHPRKEYSITISFGCSPDRIDELVAAAIQQIDSLKQKQPADDYITKVKEIQRRQYEVNLKENRYWLNSLHSYYVNGGNPNGILRYPLLVDGLTAAAIQHAAKKYFDMNNYAKFVLRPERN